jgi:hypothetical protein
MLRRIFKRRKDKTGLRFILYWMDTSPCFTCINYMGIVLLFCFIKQGLIVQFIRYPSSIKNVGIAANIPKPAQNYPYRPFTN